MSVNSDLPPQAYTRETMVEAFSWLQTQTDPVRQMAISMDAMVSLYLRAQRHGVQSLAPVSSKNFQSELNTLAKGLSLFEGQTEDEAQEEPAIDSASLKYGAKMDEEQDSTPSTPNSNTSIEMNDPSSQQLIQEVQQSLNLSCEEEALRAIISVGAAKILQLFREK